MSNRIVVNGEKVFMKSLRMVWECNINYLWGKNSRKFDDLNNFIDKMHLSNILINRIVPGKPLSNCKTFRSFFTPDPLKE
jgi:hypothetical protein